MITSPETRRDNKSPRASVQRASQLLAARAAILAQNLTTSDYAYSADQPLPEETDQYTGEEEDMQPATPPPPFFSKEDWEVANETEEAANYVQEFGVESNTLEALLAIISAAHRQLVGADTTILHHVYDIEMLLQTTPGPLKDLICMGGELTREERAQRVPIKWDNMLGRYSVGSYESLANAAFSSTIYGPMEATHAYYYLALREVLGQKGGQGTIPQEARQAIVNLFQHVAQEYKSIPSFLHLAWKRSLLLNDVQREHAANFRFAAALYKHQSDLFLRHLSDIHLLHHTFYEPNEVKREMAAVRVFTRLGHLEVFLARQMDAALSHQYLLLNPHPPCQRHREELLPFTTKPWEKVHNLRAHVVSQAGNLQLPRAHIEQHIFPSTYATVLTYKTRDLLAESMYRDLLGIREGPYSAELQLKALHTHVESPNLALGAQTPNPIFTTAGLNPMNTDLNRDTWLTTLNFMDLADRKALKYMAQTIGQWTPTYALFVNGSEINMEPGDPPRFKPAAAKHYHRRQGQRDAKAAATAAEGAVAPNK